MIFTKTLLQKPKLLIGMEEASLETQLLGLAPLDHLLPPHPATTTTNSNTFFPLKSLPSTFFIHQFSENPWISTILSPHKNPTKNLSPSLPLSASMAVHLFLLLLFLSSLISLPFSESKLSLDYYQKTCPNFQRIVQDVVFQKQQSQTSTAAATLRIFFHDCMVQGCDASLLISSNSFNNAERDSDLNLSLAGDGFDVINRAKNQLELACPGIVSCADIIAQSTRDLVKYVGGPFYKVRLGRKDGFVSRIEDVKGNLPLPNMTIDESINFFRSKGFSVQEMVALHGAHTIGFAHCKEIKDRIFGEKPDPTLNPVFAKRLRTENCKNYEKEPAAAAYLDPMTPGKFDNMYFRNLKRGLGLLAMDSALVGDLRTKPFVEMYASNETKFFEDFAHAMEKVSVHGVKTGRKGEVRRRCDAFNNILT